MFKNNNEIIEMSFHIQYCITHTYYSNNVK